MVVHLGSALVRRYVKECRDQMVLTTGKLCDFLVAVTCPGAVDWSWEEEFTLQLPHVTEIAGIGKK